MEIIKKDVYEKRIVELNDLDPNYASNMRQTRVTMEAVFVCKHEFSPVNNTCKKCGKTQEDYYKSITTNDNDYFADVMLNGKLIERTRHHR